jgi:hypothetical protein
MLTETAVITPVGHLVLAWLLVPRKKAAQGALRKDLDPLFSRRLSAGEWQELLDRTLGQLQSARLLAEQSLALSDAGRAQTLAFLGLDRLPPRTNWKQLRDQYLVPRALGITGESRTARQRVATAEGLRAVILKDRFNLPLGDGPTLAQAVDSLTARELGLKPGQKLTLKAVRALALRKLLQTDTGDDPGKLAGQLAVHAAGALRDNADQLRQAVLSAWLNQQPPPSGAGATPAPEPPASQSEEPLDLAAFAAQVQATARACPTGRFGDNKVFISHVWRRLRREGTFSTMDLTEFKRRLGEANHAGLLRLSRADLVEVMDPTDVRESETSYRDLALFHFVQI